MNKATFIQQVLYILNEADADISGAELIGADTTKLSIYVENLFPAAWRRAVGVLFEKRRNWFTPVSITAPQKTVNAPDGTGYVIMPDDYLKLYAFKMKGWREQCLAAQDETPEINRKQQNEYLRGTPQRPVCVLRYQPIDNSLKRVLYYYSVPKGASENTHIIETALYIPNVTAIPDNIDDRLAEPLAYMTASTVLSSLEKSDAAQKTEAKILEMI